MAHDVFLSYSSKDKPTADATCAKLESRGIRVWMAPRDIEPGADWSGSIIDAINGSRAMVLVFSSNANTSQQIKREVERGVHKGIPIIPLRIENVVPEKSLEYFISTPHWLDAYTAPLDRHLDYLADVLRHILDGDPVPQPPPPSPPPWWRGRLGVVAGACALAVLLLTAWFAWLRPPPGFIGTWTATALDMRQFTPENGLVGAEIPPQLLGNVLKNGDAHGTLTVDPTGQFTLAVDGQDRGSVRASPPVMRTATGNSLTFVSDVTHQTLTVGVMLSGNGTYDPQYNQPPDGRSAWDMIFMPEGQQSGAGIGNFSGTPNRVAPRGGGVNTLQMIATTWQPKQYAAAQGLNGNDPDDHVSAALTIARNGQYVLTYSLREKGVWKAAEGNWSRQIPSGAGYSPPSTDGGTYSFTGRDQVTLIDQYGSSVWRRGS